jgi:hypothetical protein
MGTESTFDFDEIAEHLREVVRGVVEERIAALVTEPLEALAAQVEDLHGLLYDVEASTIEAVSELEIDPADPDSMEHVWLTLRSRRDMAAMYLATRGLDDLPEESLQALDAVRSEEPPVNDYAANRAELAAWARLVDHIHRKADADVLTAAIDDIVQSRHRPLNPGHRTLQDLAHWWDERDERRSGTPGDHGTRRAS